MKLVNAQQMRSIEERTAAECRLPLLLLMENAGRAVAEVAAQMLATAGTPDGPVLVCCGKGNNGGDGLVAARQLLARGVAVSVLLFADPDELQGDALLNLDAASGAGVSLYIWGQDPGGDVQPADEEVARALLDRSRLVIDALLGTGSKGAPRGAVAAGIALLQGCKAPVVAVDIPSGVEAGTGHVPGEVVQATATVTFGLAKLGHYLYPGAAHTGRLQVDSIGIPPRAIAAEAISTAVLTGATVAGWLPALPANAHKGTRGRVCVVAGSRGMGGAAALCARAALRGGAGLVSVAVPAAIQAQVAPMAPEVMVQAAADGGSGTFSLESVDDLLKLAAGADVAAIGPGFGRTAQTQAFSHRLVAGLQRPAVLDADGLYAFAGHLEVLRSVQAPLVLTPHPGELAALLGITTSAVEADRLGALQQAVRTSGAVVVLKGAHTLVGNPEGDVYVNPTGNRGLATAGSGDVLSGLIAALLAQGLAPFQAAAAGVYLHGLAGDLAAERMGYDGLLAGDLAAELPLARRRLQEGDVRF